MERYGDPGRRIAVLEFGWTTDDGRLALLLARRRRRNHEEVKGDYLVRALKYARGTTTGPGSDS